MPDYIANMSLEEQIGQLLMAGFPTTSPSPEIIDLIQNQHIGGIILFSRNVQDTRQLLELTNSLQITARAAGHRYPLLIAIDQENGMVQRLGDDAIGFPGNMALGAIGSEQLVYDVAQATGRELKACGINMNLAPVVDVNNNPANPVIGVRSFGEDARDVARLTSAAVKGYRAAGVITCLKHFPGHGDTAVDSHLSLPTIPYTLERLQAIELAPFRSGIAAGADSVMIAHIHFPSLMPREVLPATVSPAIVRELLREQLGFAGVIISDCLEMQAVADTIGVGPGSVMALQAGIDLVLISHKYARQLAGIEAIQAALRTGALSPETVSRAAERVLQLKERFLSWEDLPLPGTTIAASSEADQQLRDRAYALSTTLVRNDEGLLPLRLEPDEDVLLIFPQRDSWTQVEDRQYPYKFFIESVRQHHPRVTVLSITPDSTDAAYEEIDRAARAAAITIMVTVNAYQDRRQVDLMQRLLHAGRPIVGLAVYNPYDLLAFPELSTYLVTYEYTRPALASAVRVLFGEQQPQGHLPVSLPGLYAVGHPVA
ncbi:MAG: beta-N-acetylhexosaminidase [Ktedonobacteraceae bacterium]